jgi:PAS domain S-box-containing protein
MQPGKTKPTASFPMWAFTAAVCFTIAVFVGLGAHTWNSYQAAKRLQGRDLQLLKLCGMVTYLDEVLTMSARMAATTGKPRWEERYRHFEPQLAEDIEELTQLAPELREHEGAAQTDAANRRLVEMEYNAFDLIRKERRDEAEALLFSEEYEAQKRIYADGMTKALTSLRSRTIEALRSQGRRTAWAVGGVISALVVLVPAWLGAFGIMRRHLAERKKVEEALRRADPRYHELFDSTIEGIGLVDEREVVQFCNAAFVNIFEEESVADLVGRSLLDYVAPDHLETISHQTGLRRKNISSRYELDIITRKKNRKTVLASVAPRFDEKGAYVGAFGAIMDITERKQVEEALRESERRFHAIFDQTFQFIGLMAPDGTLMEANRSALSFAGIEETDVLGKPFWETPWWTHSSELQDRLRDAVSKAAAGEFIRFEATHPAGDGHLHHIDFSLKPVADAVGNVNLLIPEGRDITERKRAETALRENEEKYRTLLENLPQKIFYKNTELAYVSCNANYAEDLGITSEEIVGRTDFEFFPKELAEKYRADDRRVINSGRAEEIEERYVHRGEERRVQTVKTPIEDDNGDVVGILGIFWDITERKRAEEALRRSEHALAKAEEIAHLGSWELDLHTRKEAWSDETYRLLGLDPQQTAPSRDTFLSRVHADDRESVLLAIGDALAGKKPYDTEFRIIRSDEKARILRSQGEVIRDESGRPVRMVGVAQDITERKRAEEALRDSSDALTKMVEEQNVLLEHTRDFVYRHDTNGLFNYLSPAVEQVTGYSVQEWWKHYTAYMTDNPINKKVIEYTEETLRTGRERPPYLVEIAHKDGRPVMLEVGERPYFEEGKVAGIVGVARDVTERHRAEVALRESEQRLEAILDNSTAVIYMKDLTGRYIVVNRRFEEVSQR